MWLCGMAGECGKCGVVCGTGRYWSVMEEHEPGVVCPPWEPLYDSMNEKYNQ